ncbi:PQQ-binding-like beta-propeller repeat protein [Halorussus caseinilyticus]|uniref:PQQ-binding-like beta-propeller repeat protein n=1 Tax=Halorussus caseinilyticus TaxID=3034025 RepID=A0ABD5WPW7_9EURY|nr:PQQ-binding-like beta-propeller repeat protein [Halorussus sp. DT72]
MTAADGRLATSERPRVRFRFRCAGSAETAPAVRDGTVFLDCASDCTHAFDGGTGTVLAFDAATGDHRWEFGTDAGNVDAIDREEGTVLWWCRADDAAVAPVTASGGTRT